MSSMSKELNYEPRVLNALTEPGAKRHAYKKLSKFQDSKSWAFSQETGEYNPVSDEEDLEREIYLALSGKLVAIMASDKKGVAGSVEALLNLAETDVNSFNALYQSAIEANPSLAEKTGVADPNG
jgi:hypothetical protein